MYGTCLYCQHNPAVTYNGVCDPCMDRLVSARDARRATVPSRAPLGTLAVRVGSDPWTMVPLPDPSPEHTITAKRLAANRYWAIPEAHWSITVKCLHGGSVTRSVMCSEDATQALRHAVDQANRRCPDPAA